MQINPKLKPSEEYGGEKNAHFPHIQDVTGRMSSSVTEEEEHSVTDCAAVQRAAC